MPQNTDTSYEPVLSAEVRAALAGGLPVVALESTIIAHGLPRPRNLQVAVELEGLVRSAGCGPGHDRRAGRAGPCRPGQGPVGAGRRGRRRSASWATAISPPRWRSGRAGRRRSPRRRSWRRGRACGSSPPAGSAACTGSGRDSQDESADLRLLARTRITVVCAGVKSILDVPATLQRLETLGVGDRSVTAPTTSPAST